jgi:hypothetical protein
MPSKYLTQLNISPISKYVTKKPPALMDIPPTKAHSWWFRSYGMLNDSDYLQAVGGNKEVCMPPFSFRA